MAEVSYNPSSEHQNRGIQMMSWKSLARARTELDLDSKPRGFWLDMLAELDGPDIYTTLKEEKSHDH